MWHTVVTSVHRAARDAGLNAFIASQRQQACIRIGVAAIFLGYLAFLAPGFARWHMLVLGSWFVHLVLNAWAWAVGIARRPIAPGRVLLLATLDIYLIAMAMFVDGGITSPLFVLLLSPVLANGMRYGRPLLVYCAAVSSFALVAMAGLAHAPASTVPWARLFVEVFGLNYVGFYAVGILMRHERAARARTALEGSLQRLLADLPLPAMVVREDGEGMCLHQANEVVRTLGLEPEALRSIHPEQLFVDDDAEAFVQACRRALQGHAPERALLRLRGHRGEHPVEARILPLLLKGKAHALVLLEDIDAALRERKALAEAQKRAYAAALVAGMAHDFRNLLAAIIGEAELLGMDLEHPRVQQAVRRIVEAADHGADIVAQLLQLGRSNGERLEVLDLAATVRRQLELVRVQLGAGVRLVFEAEPGLPQVRAHPPSIQQILLNLVDNAVKAMQGKGEITVRVRREGRGVALEVQDTGPGIPREHMAHIFLPFWTTRGSQGGTGLGLAMVRELAARQGASLDVRSEPGRGACFRLLFPPVRDAVNEDGHGPDAQVDARLHAETQQDRAASPLAGRGVLVVDDEPLVLEVLVRAVERFGARAWSASSPREALAVFSSHADAIQAALLDWCMPEMNGGELAARLLEIRPDLDVVFVTGNRTEVEKARMDLPPKILDKPVSPLAVARALAAMPGVARSGPTAISTGPTRTAGHARREAG